MSMCAPTRELSRAELTAELRRTLAWAIDRVETHGAVYSCTGLDTAPPKRRCTRTSATGHRPAWQPSTPPPRHGCAAGGSRPGAVRPFQPIARGRPRHGAECPHASARRGVPPRRCWRGQIAWERGETTFVPADSGRNARRTVRGCACASSTRLDSLVGRDRFWLFWLLRSRTRTSNAHRPLPCWHQPNSERTRHGKQPNIRCNAGRRALPRRN